MPKIFEYLINQNTGTGVTSIIDTSSHANHLTPNYSTTMSIVGGVAGNGLTNTADGGLSVAHASAPISSASGAGQAIHGITQCTLILKMTPVNPAYPWSTALYVGNASTASFFIGRNAIEVNEIQLGGLGFAFYGHDVLVLAYDSTAVDPADRLKVYTRDYGSFTEMGYDSLDGPIPLNHAITVPADAEIILMNDFSRDVAGPGGSWSGSIWHAAMVTEVLTAVEAEALIADLMLDDDVSYFESTPETLAWVSAPAFDQITSTSGRLQLTANLPVDLSFVVTASGSTQPTEGEFDGGIQSSVNANTNYQRIFSGLDAGESYRVWTRATSGGSSIYGSADITTLNTVGSIVSINGGQPLRPGMTNIVVIWTEGASLSTDTIINGVTQNNHQVINDNETRFDYIWSNLMYNTTGTLTSGGLSATTPVIQPPFGSFYVTAGSGYNPATPGAITAFPSVSPGLDQLEVIDQSGATAAPQWWEYPRVTVDENFIPSFYIGFDGYLVCRLIDHTDGSRSEPEIIPYSTSPVGVVTGPDTYRRSTSFALTVSPAGVAPTLGNTSITLGGRPLVLSGISGTGPYSFQVTVPTNIQLKYATSGLDLVVTINGEILTIEDVAFLPPVGSNYQEITSINTAKGSVFYLGTLAPQVNSQVEWRIKAGSGSLSLTSSGVWIWATRPLNNVTIEYRYIDPNGIPHAVAEHIYVINPSDPGILPLYTLSTPGVNEIGGTPTYAGAFIPNDGDDYGDSNAGFWAELGAIAISETPNRMYTTGLFSNSVAEVTIPALVLGNDVNALNVGTVVQNFKYADPLRSTFSMDPRILGITPYNGQLIIGGTGAYEVTNRPENYMVYRDADNLATGGTAGMFQVTGARHNAGWLAEIPVALRPLFDDKTHLAGHGGNLSILGTTVAGISMYAINAADIIAATTPGQTVSAIVVADYDSGLGQAMGYDPERTFMHADVWNFLSSCGGFFFVPNTRTLMAIGTNWLGRTYDPRIDNEILYKTPGLVDAEGYGDYGGHFAYYPNNYTPYYWLFDVNQLAEVVAGTRLPYQVTPYRHGLLPALPFFNPYRGGNVLGGSKYDPLTNRLYYLIRGAAGSRFGGMSTVGVLNLAAVV